ncbi:tRNA (mnm(5)s(2)U34)-methyltransferase [Streptococcus sp. DD12]|uniref:tRNA (mnm(5)s(2)U34)-methyltransferase n=1 Tax=Streptococcus sp. DD12 TaxID=1777880 RepID=UPI000795BFFC|nr:class I SAM-dependent methyltransferase [Streptococcus sp. DD12]KXT75977.1 SAM-dependent methyltransferase, MraW methylase family [Streptococcus sp. DD12]
MMKRPLELSHDFLAQVLDDQSVAVDATMGNGYDTLFLAQQAGQVYAFDVQKKALQKTQERLDKAGVTNVQLILDGHENLGLYVPSAVTAAIFNLGYLPSADKSVVTQAQTTLSAIDQLLERLVSGGRIALMVYYGHPGGESEKQAVLAHVSALDQRVFTVMTYGPINQINTPPFLVMIEKK